MSEEEYLEELRRSSEASKRIIEDLDLIRQTRLDYSNPLWGMVGPLIAGALLISILSLSVTFRNLYPKTPRDNSIHVIVNLL